MTPDRAHFLGATAQAFHGEGLDFMGIAPLDLLALLAERERLRGALETVKRQVPFTRAYLIDNGIEPNFADVLLSHYTDAARQALEATDDQ